MAFFSKKWEMGLSKTRTGILDRISGALRGKRQLDEATLEELEQILIESDVGFDTAMRLFDALRSRPAGKGDAIEEGVRALLKSEILETLKGPSDLSTVSFMKEQPHVIVVVGVNGMGKTTTIGKLAHRFRQDGQKVLLAGSDTFRAAAGEQLAVWANRAGADLIRQKSGSDPASVAYDALDAAMARNVDVLMVDTAGRLHTKVNLMEELKKINRVLKKRLESAPHEVLLVLDATTGQNGLSQAKLFRDAVDVTGIVLTKLDGTARGGIVVAIHQMLGIPVQWVGLGEGIDDLVPFDADAFVKGMLG